MPDPVPSPVVPAKGPETWRCQACGLDLVGNHITAVDHESYMHAGAQTCWRRPEGTDPMNDQTPSKYLPLAPPACWCGRPRGHVGSNICTEVRPQDRISQASPVVLSLEQKVIEAFYGEQHAVLIESPIIVEIVTSVIALVRVHDAELAPWRRSIDAIRAAAFLARGGSR